MKTLLRSMMFTSVLVLGMSGLTAAQANNWSDQRYKANYGRPSPTEEARLKAELDTTAFRQEIPYPAAPLVDTWMRQYFKAKFGRNTPADEARLKAERENSAFREEPRPQHAPTTWIDQRYKAKYGRTRGGR